jgi:hypothetical protein
MHVWRVWGDAAVRQLACPMEPIKPRSTVDPRREKTNVAAEQACRSRGGSPRHDVIFDGRQNIGRRQIDGLALPLKHQPAPDTAEGLVQGAHVGCRFIFFDLLVHTSCTRRSLTI